MFTPQTYGANTRLSLGITIMGEKWQIVTET